MAKLATLGLGRDEAKIYLELNNRLSTHLQLSRETGVNRTKVYRIIAALEKKGLVARRTDDRGTFLTACDLSVLELRLAEREERIKKQRGVLQEVIPDLNMLRQDSGSGFFVQTYEGATGYKQMVWHELQAKGEVLALGNGTIEEEASDEYWSKRHRQRQIEAGYVTREITNYAYGAGGMETFTAQELLQAGLYEHRRLSPEILTFDGQTIIYNDTVSIYHWKHEKKVGLEIISRTYAEMMRQMFYLYWDQAAAQEPIA
jgi:DNA-binding MarR family transcriptional regulator